eukprot:5623064-Ditylum_brightwellii.AAC.1
MVLAVIVMGVGGEEITNLVTFLDLQHPKGMGRVAMPHIEDDIGEKYKTWLVHTWQKEWRRKLD